MEDRKLNYFQECVFSLCRLHNEYLEDGKLSPMELIGAIYAALHLTEIQIETISKRKNNE